MRRIAVDAMGGENAPQAIVEAVLKAKKELPETEFILFGDEAKLKELVGSDRERVQIVPTTEVIQDEDEPVKAMRTRRTPQWSSRPTGSRRGRQTPCCP